MGLKILAAFLVLLPLPTFAAFTIPTLAPTIDISLNPESPGPRQTVSVRAENVSAGATFVWRVNGSVVDQGVGVRGTTVTTGPLGSETTVSVSVTDGGVSKGEKSMTLRPAEVDLVWEGNTYTPPFYLGRPLMNPSSSVRLMAVPHLVVGGVRVGASDLVYTWYMNGSQTPLITGYGKSMINVTAPQFINPFSVTVRAATRDGATVAEQEAVIEPTLPDIVVYEQAPLLGTRFERAIEDTFTLADEETTFVAYPLHIGNVDSPAYAWSLNGDEVAGDTPREITFRRQGEGSGAYSVEFSLENTRALFERASKEFVIRF